MFTPKHIAVRFFIRYLGLIASKFRKTLNALESTIEVQLMKMYSVC